MRWPRPTSSASPGSTAPNTTSGRGILAGYYLVFNWRRGVFQDKRLRTAAAHAIDREAIHQTVYYGQGEILNQCYPKGDPWYLEGIRSLEYDPDRAKAMLKEARAVGTAVKIIANTNLSIARETVQVVQEAWNTVGFKATIELLDTLPLSLPLLGRAISTPASVATPTASTRMTFMRAICTLRASGVGATPGGTMSATISLVEEAKRTLDISPAQRAVHRGPEHRQRRAAALPPA